MQYLGLTAFSELGNCFVNDRQVEISVIGISLLTVMACGTLAVSYTHLDVYKRQKYLGLLKNEEGRQEERQE